MNTKFIKTKCKKQIFTFKEVLFYLSKDYRNYIEGIETYNLNFSKNHNKLLIEIHYYFLSLDKSKLIGKIFVDFDYIKSIFFELEKKGYKIAAAYKEFQKLITNY